MASQLPFEGTCADYQHQCSHSTSVLLFLLLWFLLFLLFVLFWMLHMLQWYLNVRHQSQVFYLCTINLIVKVYKHLVSCDGTQTAQVSRYPLPISNIRWRCHDGGLSAIATWSLVGTSLLMSGGKAVGSLLLRFFDWGNCYISSEMNQSFHWMEKLLESKMSG